MAERPVMRGSLWPWLALGLAVLFIAYQLVQDCRALMAQTGSPQVWRVLFVALLAYLGSHVFRFLRFALLVKGQRLRTLLHVYALTTGASYAIPFKLGELFRMLWIGLYADNLGRGLIVVWVERILDAAMIGLIYLLIAASHPEIKASALSGALILIPFLIVLSVLFLKVLPENMNNLNLWILRSYKGTAATQRLRWLDKVRLFAQQANDTLANRALSLAMLTLCIWGLEVFAIYLALGALQDSSNGMAVFVSKIASIINPAAAQSSTLVQAIEGFSLSQGVLIGVLASVSVLTAAITALRGHWEARA